MAEKTNYFSLEQQLLKDYDVSHDRDGISGKRLAHRLGELSKIGLTEQNGSNRPGFSLEEKQAKDLVAQWMREAGLDVREDGAGNVFGRLSGKNDSAPAILSGSHVDSVPNGGHFDGVLGVLSALEVVEAWRETGYQPEKPFEVVIFTDEEGARFNSGLSGSEAMMGKIDMNDKRQLRDSKGKSFEDVLKSVGLSALSYEKASRNINDIETFVELHIEQGKRLEKEDLPCGIVTGIAGPSWLEFTFMGEAGHAGNTPMDDRKDALVAASEFIVNVSQLPRQINDSAVATVGKIHVSPNGVNVIPGRVTLYVDIRDIYADTRDQLIEQVIQVGTKIAKKYNINVEYVEKTRVPPVPIDHEKQQLLEDTLKDMGIKPYYLPSGAGHDAMVLGENLPVAMIFVRSKDGISHNPTEWTDLTDSVIGVRVLKSYIERLQ